MKKYYIWLLGLLMLFQQVQAQEQITGKIRSGNDNQPLPGVSVSIKGTTVGTATDAQGNYRLTTNLPANAVLVFSSIGFKPQEIAVGNRRTIDLVMDEEIRALSEVVVTAVGIERGKAGLGYAVGTLNNQELTKAREANVVNALAGKLPGVVVTNQSGTAGGSSRIVIRGVRSFGGDNQPLFVVDGVPISNSNFNGNFANDRINGGNDIGNRASDINPDDIATISVLKGAAATALYGSRAKDGAVVITTKRGSQKKKSTVAYSASLRFDSPLRLPDFQNDYAGGTNGKYDNTNPIISGWGPKISGQKVRLFSGDSTKLQAYPNNVKDFFETGRTTIHNLSFGSANEQGDFRLGFTQLQQTGIIPNNTSTRHTISLNGGIKLPNNFNARVGMNYVRTNNKGLPAQGGNNANVIVSNLYGLSRTFDTGELRNYIDEFGRQKALDKFTNNPYWLTNENISSILIERMFGFAQVGYTPFNWLDVTYRLGTDFFQDYRERRVRKGTIGIQEGSLAIGEYFNREINSDLIITATKSLNDNLSLKGIFGHNINQRTIRRFDNTSQNLTIDGLYNTVNATANTPVNFNSIRRLYGVYADLGVSYKDFLFLNATGRNDWSSTLPVNNHSYFYPSISSSFIFTEALKMDSKVLSYGKIRANFAQVGSDEAPYQLNFLYTPVPDIYVQFLPRNTLPITTPNGTVQAFAGPNTVPPPNLRPQKQNSLEFGTEIQFFNGRLGLDLTYYNTITSDQIISIAIPQSTGYGARRDNVGKVQTRGIEVLITATPIKMASGFKWDMSLNFSRNTQKVLALAPGLNEFNLLGGFNGVQIKAEPGKAFGLYGTDWDRDTLSGKAIINPNTGLRAVSSTTKRLGNIFPDFTMGIQNNFSYKGLNVSFLIDIRQGGKIYSGTTYVLRNAGLAAETAANREGTFVDDGVLKNPDGTFRPNDVPVTSMQAFWQNYSAGNVTSSNLFDAGFVKLRELRVAYQFPQALLQRTPFGLLEVGIEGRNLWLIKSKIPHIDPEASVFGSGVVGDGYEFNNIPSTRSIGFNVRVTF